MKKINDINSLGILLRQTRKSQGITQQQLSMVSGVGIRFIRELEYGKETCEIGKAIRVMDMLGINFFTDFRGSRLEEKFNG